ncbi:MAG TPA: winged helix-turn-helix domain-containing protein [Rhizomicrobium sp.]|jgi:TolB-like protein/DNA-binding winged helix-turn-helix (wHTH) protein
MNEETVRQGHIDLSRESDFSLGVLQISPSTREVVRDGRRETLEPKATQVLVALHQARGRVVSRDELIARCWDGRIVGEDAINRVIWRLRRLSEDDAIFTIETIPKVGYRLLLPAGKAEPPAVSPPTRHIMRIGRRPVILGCAVVAGIGAIAAAWRAGLFGASRALANSVAVLPFANVGGSPAQDYFADGLSAEVRAALARNTLLRVVGQVSSNAFKSSSEDAETIARKLGVAFLLDGNVRLAANHVRVSAELIQGESGFSRWAQTFDRAIDDIFAVQSEIADAVAAALTREVAVTTPVTQAGGTTNVAAFDAYLRGRADFALAAGPDTDHSALAHFEGAIAYDPKFGAAYAARSRTLVAIANQQAAGGERQLLYDQAIAAAKQSIVLAPDLAAAHSALAFALVSGRLDFRGARTPYERSYALGRGDPDVLGRYALYCAQTGRLRDAEAAIRQARDLDPLNPRTYFDIGYIQFFARHFGDAISSLDRVLALSPQMANVNGYRGYCFLLMGKLDDAERAFQKETSPITRLPGLAMVAKRRGNEVGSREGFARLVAELGTNGLYQQAEVLAQWGDDKAAVAALNLARTNHDPGLFMAGEDPLLDGIRANSDFLRLLKELGLGG